MDTTGWRPKPGQVGMIETRDPEAAREALTAVVLDDNEAIRLSLGASPRLPADKCEVVASFFAPDALYRVEAVALSTDGGDLVELEVRNVERVQRRLADRAKMTLPVSLSALDGPGPVVSVAGETIDLGEGGCRVRTAERFPPGADATVILRLPSGERAMAMAQVLELHGGAGNYEYRLVFSSIDDADRERLVGATDSR